MQPATSISISRSKGVLIVWATWSLPAKRALEALAASLSSHADFEEISLWVADNDEEKTQQFMDSVGQTPCGTGETFWIRNGQIVARLSNYTALNWSLLIQTHEAARSGIAVARFSPATCATLSPFVPVLGTSPGLGSWRENEVVTTR
jgi:hypothetical protein